MTQKREGNEKEGSQRGPKARELIETKSSCQHDEKGRLKRRKLKRNGRGNKAEPEE